MSFGILRLSVKRAMILLGGIADFDYGHWYKEIQAYERFTTPKLVVAVGESLLKVCDKLVKAQNPNIAPIC
jgi:alpha-galactosidase